MSRTIRYRLGSGKGSLRRLPLMEFGFFVDLKYLFSSCPLIHHNQIGHGERQTIGGEYLNACWRGRRQGSCWRVESGVLAVRLWGTKTDFLKVYFFFITFELCVYLCTGKLTWVQGSMEFRRGCWLPESWCSRRSKAAWHRCWYRELSFDPLQEERVRLTMEPTLQPHQLILFYRYWKRILKNVCGFNKLCN